MSDDSYDTFYSKKVNLGVKNNKTPNLISKKDKFYLDIKKKGVPLPHF